ASRHARADDAWLVIGGEVFDVTPWLEDHPGGRMLLLSFAGRDATDAFESVGHSALARREMRRLRVGRVQRDDEPHNAGGGALVGRKATLTGGRATSSADLCEAAPRADERGVWRVEEHGFLPRSDPVGLEALHGTGFEAFAKLADDLPALGVGGDLKALLDSDVELQRQLRAAASDVSLLSDDEAERAFAVVGYTMREYTQGIDVSRCAGAAGGDGQQGGSCGRDACPAARLPAFLAEPLLALSGRLQRPPMIDYASSVCAMRLTGLLDEEWFFKTHVVIESEASHVVSALIGAMRSGEESELLEHLVALEDAMWRVVRACLPIMYERDTSGTPKCSPDVFYTILRPLIKSGELVFEGDSGPSALSLNGPSGAMSTLLPAVDAALGIKMTSEKLREALDQFELSMPLGHREFLAELRGQPSIRERLMFAQPSDGAGEDQHSAAVRSFNRCISRVLDFRWQHWTYIKNFILRPGNISYGLGSGGTTFDFLQQHITDTERARLTELGG
ncbi:unnamed protein product, partial [Prorocentrum cordatum]